METNAGSHYRTALSPFHSQVGHHKWDIYFLSFNFPIIDFPSLRLFFSFLFLLFLPCGLVYTLAARHMMYRSVPYGQYTAQYSTEKTNNNRWENDLDIYIYI